jgi:hypothetical protein
MQSLSPSHLPPVFYNLRKDTLSQEHLTEDAAYEFLMTFSGHEAVDGLKAIWSKLDPETANRVLISTWCREPRPYRHYDFWVAALPRFPVSDNEAALSALPDTLTIYRGGDMDSAAEGFSWTLSRRIAEDFARLENNNMGSSRYAREFPELVTATIPKSAVSLHITGRKEEEIVLHPVNWPRSYRSE